MPYGGNKAVVTRLVFPPFTLISAVTATTDASNSLAVLTSNTESWAAGDLLIGICAGAHGNTTRTSATPSPNSWTPGTETWTERWIDRAIVSTSAISFNGFTTTALSTETTKSADVGFDSTMFTLISALLVCDGASIIRQVSPVSKVEDTTTSITATLGSSPLTTSQVVSVVAQRATTAFVQPTNFTLIEAIDASTNTRLVISARIGHDSTSVTSTGLSSSSVAKEAVAFEIARPGQEL